MRIIVTLIFCVVLGLSAWQLVLQHPPSSTQTQAHGLPWQVERLPENTTRVFNLHPGIDTLAQARSILGEDFKFGIIAKDGELGALELFYTRFQTGHLTGKLVLIADLPPETLKQLKQQADKRTVLSNGSSIYTLKSAATEQAWQARIKHIHYVPTVSLNQSMVTDFFGEPSITYVQAENVTLYAYPELGISIYVDNKGKDFIIYQRPDDSTAPSQEALPTIEKAP